MIGSQWNRLRKFSIADLGIRSDKISDSLMGVFYNKIGLIQRKRIVENHYLPL